MSFFCAYLRAMPLTLGLLGSVNFLALTLPPLAAQATEIKTLTNLQAEQPATGLADSIAGALTIVNATSGPVVVTYLPKRSPYFSFDVESQQVALKPGERRALKFKGAIKTPGKWEIDLEFSVKRQDSRGELARHAFELYYDVSKSANGALAYRVSNYEELFLKRNARDIPGQGRVFGSIEDTGQLPKGDDYRTNKQPEMRLWPQKPDRELSRRIPPGSGIGQGPRDETFEELLQRMQDFLRAPGRALDSFAATQAQGVFSWLGVDNVLHPAWGWRVRAWLQSGGSWSKVAEDWIEWDGKWSLTFDRPAGTKVQFQYVAYNRYFTPQSNDGDTYRWVGPVRDNVAASHNEGGWLANTSTGNVRGLGELYKDAYTMWSNLYWQGNINPLRSESIKVIFPNLTYKCGGDSVWSCANKGGTIWLIPSHGINGQTIIHELGHQLNYEYWDNTLPDGTGGSHSMDQCYTAGLALTEGFANFMVGWTKTNRDNNTPMFRNLENAGEINACTTKDLNEAWVGNAFWDLHDKVTDGKDTLYFVHRGAVPGLFLNAGMKQKMSLFRDTYRNAANADHRTIIDDIFKQNNVF